MDTRILACGIFVSWLLAGCSPEAGVTSGDVNEAIAEHAKQQAAHHLKTRDASELTEGVLDAERLPDIPPDKLSFAGTGVPHDCQWVVNTDTTNSTNRRVFCPANTFPISGGCHNNTNTLEMSRPLPSSIADGDGPTAADSWYCQWDVASTAYEAQALCCSF